MGVRKVIKQIPVLPNLAFDFLNWEIALKQRKENISEMKQIATLKGIYAGKRCFIIGTGPSLTVSDLELLSDEITFATNRIYELFEKTKWRPTYYVNQDHNLLQTFEDKIKNVEAELMFLPVDYKEHFKGEKYRFFVLKHKEFYPYKAPFSTDISKYLAQGFTVTYGAIQIAMYMGFTEIYLLGIDHNYNIFRDAKGRPIRQKQAGGSYAEGMQSYVNMNNLPRIEETTIAYETAEAISKKRGVKIYNATRGGKLEVFERIKLEDVLEE